MFVEPRIDAAISEAANKQITSENRSSRMAVFGASVRNTEQSEARKAEQSEARKAEQSEARKAEQSEARKVEQSEARKAEQSGDSNWNLHIVETDDRERSEELLDLERVECNEMIQTIQSECSRRNEADVLNRSSE